MTVRILQPGETIITEKRQAELEQKERAHDAYMRATRRMRVRQDAVLDKARDPRTSTIPRAKAEGWLAAMHEFGEVVMEEASKDA